MKIDSIPDVQQRENDLKVHNKTFLETLEQVKQNYEPLKKDLIDVLAIIRVAGGVRSHSLFGYLSILFKLKIFFQR